LDAITTEALAGWHRPSGRANRVSDFLASTLLRVLMTEIALGGKSRHRNNFGSYGWYKRRGERLGFMPEFDEVDGALRGIWVP
jgi:hypothetical protein